LLYNPVSADELQPAAIQKLLTSFNEAKRARNLPNILQFSADSNYMAVGYSDLCLEVGQIRGWRTLLPEIKRLGSVEAEENVESLITSAVFEPDNKSVITGEYNGQILTWNLATGVPQIVGKHAATVSGLLLLPDGAVASGSYDGTLRRWRTSPGSRTSTDFPVLERDAWATGLVGLPRPGDSYWLVTAWDDGALVLCDQEGYDTRTLIENLPLNVLAPSPEGGWLAALGQDGQLMLWQNNSNEPLPIPVNVEPPQDALGVTALSFSKDTRWLAAGDSRGGLQVLDLQTPHLGWNYTRLPQDDQAAVRCLTWVDPNRTLVAYMDGKLALEDTAGLLTPLAYYT
jgi:WD40 repeat protein